MYGPDDRDPDPALLPERGNFILPLVWLSGLGLTMWCGMIWAVRQFLL